MNVDLVPGKYIIAVSGGVDSIVLLDLLAHMPDVELVVAHLDHGIRKESGEDAAFVARIAKVYGLECISFAAALGSSASEATAREHRYRFLLRVMESEHANAILTAHHQDDMIETALINILRGTKRKGFVSLKSEGRLLRPLLGYTKQQILEYALQKKLVWQEDATNSSEAYLRNRIRSVISESVDESTRAELIDHLSKIIELDREINLLADALSSDGNTIHKGATNKLYLAEAYEIIAAWLRKNGVGFDSDTLKRLVIGMRILQNGAQIDVSGGYYVEIDRYQITLKRR